MSSISENTTPKFFNPSEPYLVIVRRRLAEMTEAARAEVFESETARAEAEAEAADFEAARILDIQTQANRIANAEGLERAEAVHYARVYNDRANRVACPKWASYYRKCADDAYPVSDDDSIVLSDDSDDSDDESTESERYRYDRRIAVLLQSARAIDTISRKARRIALGFTGEELLAHNGAEMISARTDRELYLERAAEIARAAEARAVRVQGSTSVITESSGVG